METYKKQSSTKQDKKWKQTLTIILTPLAVLFLILSVFVNDKYISISIMCAVLSVAFSNKTSNPQTNKKSIQFTKKERTISKIALLLSIILVVTGIIVAIFYV